MELQSQKPQQHHHKMSNPTETPPPVEAKKSFFDSTLQAFGKAFGGSDTPPEPVQPTPAPVEPPKQQAPATPTTGVPSFGTEPVKATDPLDGFDVDNPQKLPKSEQWKALRSQRDLERREKESLKAEIEQIKTKLSSTPATNPKEIEDLKRERDEFSKKLQEFAVTHHPQFEQYFNGKMNQALNVAVNTIGGDEGKRVAQLIAMPESEYRNRELESVMSSLTAIQQAKLGSVLVSVEQINAEKQAEIARSNENYSKIQEQEKQKVAQTRQQFQTILENQLSEAKKHLPLPEDDWNNVQQTARSIFSENSTQDDFSKAAVWTAVAPRLAAQVHALSGENQKLRAQLAKLETASPSISNGQSTPNNGQDEYKGLTFGQIVAKKATQRS